MAPAPSMADKTTSQSWMRALEAVAAATRDASMTLPAIIAELARRHGDATALLSDSETLSFRTLAERMNLYSRWALAQNIAPGEVVGLLMPNRPEYLAIWLGLTQVGGVVALLNTNLTSAALAHCIDVAGTRHIIVAGELASAFASAAPYLSQPPRPWFHGAGGADRIDLMISNQERSDLDLPAERIARQDDRALCIYTSGTTGMPKAANVSHRRVVAWSTWFAALGDFGPGDRMYDCLPMYHSVGGVVAVASALVGGGSVVIAEKFSARGFWNDIVRWDCTIFQYIGELCRFLVNAPDEAAVPAHRLRLACGNGLGADIWPAFQQRFSVPRILEFYAATESNFSLFNVEGKVGAIGRLPAFLKLRDPVALVRLSGEDNVPERGLDGLCIRCKAGEPGEAIGRIAGDSGDASSRFEGYTNALETEKKILRDVFKPGDAWMQTGDLMRCDEQGFYFFIDRLGDTFRWKGENVATQEVANLLRTCPGVADAAVYGVKVPGAEGRAGMAWLGASGGVDLADLQRRLDSLPAYARPVFIRIARSLDVTETFKHKRTKMAREGYDPREINDALFVFSRTDGAYVKLDGARFAAIQSGRARL